MSIKTEIDRIKQSKADIISALETKGVTVPSDASIDDLSALVDAIEVASDPVLQSKTVSPTTSKQTVTPDTGYDGLSQVTVNAMTTATQATPSISVSSSGLITASATQTAGYVSAGTKSATKQLTTKGATTYTPTTSNQTIASGTYLTGTQTIKGDSNLVASNIKSGVSIFGVTGSMSASEDLSSELSTQSTLITTQETTIDSIISALEGKASGGSGGSVETCKITIETGYGITIADMIYTTVDTNGQPVISTTTATTFDYVKGTLVCMNINSSGGADHWSPDCNDVEYFWGDYGSHSFFIPASSSATVATMSIYSMDPGL